MRGCCRHCSARACWLAGLALLAFAAVFAELWSDGRCARGRSVAAVSAALFLLRSRCALSATCSRCVARFPREREISPAELRISRRFLMRVSLLPVCGLAGSAVGVGIRMRLLCVCVCVLVCVLRRVNWALDRRSSGFSVEVRVRAPCRPLDVLTLLRGSGAVRRLSWSSRWSSLALRTGSA